MGWRFRKRIKIFPGFYINISKSGLGVNIGPKGANVSVGPNGTYVNTGIPGTGLYRRDKVDSPIYSTTGIQQESQNYREQEVTPIVGKEEQQYGDSVVSHLNTHHTPVNQKDNHSEISDGDISMPYDPKRDLENYHYPTIDLLKKYDYDGTSYVDMEEQNANKNRIVDVLWNFGVVVSTIKASVGPRVTLYEIMLAPGVNASKLKGLEDDIALALSSHDVHFLIPIPGKGTIGIEVPNIRPSVVPMESILNTKQFQETTMELPCAIGKTITNEVFMFDLTKAPHILIAGSTGQGKSIALNTMIMSLLYKKHPAELKLVLMDPYGVEFGVYAQIAKQFLASLPNEPVIVSNSGQAISTLNSLCKEMETRYDLLKMACVRNVQEYNNKFVNRQLNPSVGHRFMPYIVVVIDEYGDFIEEKGQDFETPIVQLAQYARAVGIHMIISTKRPTNDIITGAIKANFPTRIAFRLPERIDSQVILDCDGAEELLGNGDMLFRAGKSIDCIRVQCAFVDTTEVERINEFISCQEGYVSSYELPDPYYDGGESYANDVDMTHLDPLFEEAARLIVKEQRCSCGLIMRKFAIGYNRVVRLMNQLEKAGIVGVSYGSTLRDVLITDDRTLEYILSHWRQ
jgi:S-DNA-T family DNA segregation ATPase FtsK/SpoIIIE